MSFTDDQTLGRRNSGDLQASTLAASQHQQHSEALLSLHELHTGSAAHEVSGYQQRAAAASVGLQDSDGEPLPPPAAPPDSRGRQLESNDVPGPPPGSPPADHRGMGEQAGSLELQASALSAASRAEEGPDESEGSDQDSDADSDVLFSSDPTDNSDPW